VIGKSKGGTGKRQLAIDIYCGLGGWTDGLLAEGYRVVGFDTMRHVYGEHRYPAQLVVQDVLTLHGAQFRDATLIVASPPCQAYSYRAMPWKRAKALPPPDNSLFWACFRIQREASEAAGRKIPMVVENVCGAQKWVGRARWHYGSFYLWGDVPALMPVTPARGMKRNPDGTLHPPGSWFAIADSKARGIKGIPHRPDGHWTNRAENGTKCCGLNWSKYGQPDYRASGTGANPVNARNDTRDHIKQGGDWYSTPGSISRTTSGGSSKRAFASAMIAKIPPTLSRHIARFYHPDKSLLT
jgi:hypothetical protein